MLIEISAALKKRQIDLIHDWMERLMGEIAKSVKNKWMSWSARGAKNC